MKKTITIQDVARKAGVGVGTVSRVLNNEVNVSQDKKERIQKVVKELNYKPNTLARNLRKQSTSTIGIIIQDVSNPFYSNILMGIQAEMVDSDYSFILSDLHSVEDSLQGSIDTLVEKRVDALIYLGSYIDEKKLKQIKKNQVPVVAISTAILIDDFLSSAEFGSVTIDNKKATYDAIQYLVTLGHKSIGFISGEKDDPNTSIPRTKGYIQALEDNHIPINRKWIVDAGYSYQAGYEAMRELLTENGNDLPTAVCCICDLAAIGATKALYEFGLNVPADMSIMGFDGISNAYYHNPSITTVKQPRYEMGKIGMALLFDMMAKKENLTYHKILDYKIVAGGSTRKV